MRRAARLRARRRVVFASLPVLAYVSRSLRGDAGSGDARGKGRVARPGDPGPDRQEPLERNVREAAVRSSPGLPAGAAGAEEPADTSGHEQVRAQGMICITHYITT